MFIYLYYETDGDSGWYHVKPFKTKHDAEAYKKSRPRTNQNYAQRSREWK